MSDLIPDALRKEILRLDMHDVPAAEIAQRVGVKRTTVSAIIRRTRKWTKEQSRGTIELLCDPAGTYKPGAMFNYPDMRTMASLSALADGTVFEVTRGDGSTYRTEMRGGKLVRMEEIPV